MRRIIAICGAKRSGKDTCASILEKEYGYTHIKIAKKLKDVCKVLFNFSDEQLENDLKEIEDKKWNTSPRKVMQFLGTEIMQYEIQSILPNIGRKFWINSLLSSISSQDKYVISDLRFLHEFEEIKKLGGLIIRMENDNLIQSDTHISELEYLKIPFDIIIKNNHRNIEDLRNSINQILQS